MTHELQIELTGYHSETSDAYFSVSDTYTDGIEGGVIVVTEHTMDDDGEEHDTELARMPYALNMLREPAIEAAYVFAIARSRE